MSSGTPSVTLQDLHSDDAEQVVKGNWAAFPSFYHDVEPVAKRSNEADRLRRCVARMQQLIDSPNTLARKAVMDGKLVGIALWFRPGAPIFNEKRRLKSSSSDEDELWIGLGSEWEDKWAAWDTERARIMGDTPHWYLAPIWVLPEYQGHGIGAQLLKDVIDRADSTTPSTPIYLEATKAGAVVYERRGFVVVGKSEYQEMVRWGNKSGQQVEA